MHFCCCQLTEVLNSTFLNTFVSGVLAFALICATVTIAKRQSKQEKVIHEQKLLSDREDRIINIYKVFADCGRVLIFLFSSVHIRMGIIPNDSDVKKLLEHRIKLSKALDEAKLIFDENSQIVKRLNVIYEKFQELSLKDLNLFTELRARISKAIEAIRKEFPNTRFESLEDISNHPDALKRFNTLAFDPREEELEKEELAFRKIDLSDENLDDYFKPYINRIPNTRSL